MEIVIRAAVIYFFLWLVTKALGKRQLAQMSPFELILLVTMGDLIQQGATQEDRSLGGAVLAVGTISVLIVIGSMIVHRSGRAREALEGYAVIVVRDGQYVDEAMRTERIGPEDVLQAARDQGIADLRDVRYGILEPEGGFSFLMNGGARTDQQRRRRGVPEVN